MKVVAKFRVQKAEHLEGGTHTLHLYPVVSGSDENKEFFKYTPAGKIELGTVNAGAAAEFVPGEEMYVTFERAPKAG